MNQILIIEELLTEMAGNPAEKYVLFGKKDTVEMGGSRYDFIFHSIAGLDFQELAPEGRLVVPALPCNLLYTGNNIELIISEMHTKNPALTTFAAWTNDPVVSKNLGEGKDALPRIEHRKNLVFYDVSPAELGLNVKKKVYVMASEDDFRKHVEGWERIMDGLAREKQAIDRQYRS